MDNLDIVLDGELSLTSDVEAETGVIIRAGEESPLGEPYGTWTDIVGKYLGRDMTTGQGLFTPLMDLNGAGEAIAGSRGLCVPYIPIIPDRTYVKNECRIVKFAFYDADKRCISVDTSGRYDVSPWGVEIQMPEGTRYIRFCVNMSSANWRIQIFRTE